MVARTPPMHTLTRSTMRAQSVEPRRAAPAPLRRRRRAPRIGHMVRCAAGLSSPVQGDITDADVALVFDFGSGSDLRPTTSNEQLARVALRLGTIPLLAQTEAAAVLSSTGRAVVDLQVLARTRFGLGMYEYVDTRGVARVAAEIVRDAGWRTVAVVAHPAHAARCAALCEAQGLDVVVPPHVSGVGFDRMSGQWWTRRRVAWVAREAAVLVHHLVAGAFRPRRRLFG